MHVPDNEAWKPVWKNPLPGTGKGNLPKTVEGRFPWNIWKPCSGTWPIRASTTGFEANKIAYARHVAGALNDGAVLTLEGRNRRRKNPGLPDSTLLEFLTRNPSARAAISTYTKSLQEQIFHRELADIHAGLSDVPGRSGRASRENPATSARKSSTICWRTTGRGSACWAGSIWSTRCTVSGRPMPTPSGRPLRNT